ncbi:tRNA uracil 4-sulfurtransferase ThiI [Alicyclobacillus dauci]|uniref:Probable tRNA sulfurtransferase n=1 Tax=Alicyclobacillus dauci TaxID=1475485 RepID=A0ABY6Z001_9BACL|nr:tRNA uracil 4-sulfurtransferase ThiI [Alicyclobacillus dauci]WAH35546.1 tRNA 4-thiouridine(8) synthase ThiI [Alicyclobacillus dauci]
MFDHILIRYGEINTKGNNRTQLERLLQRNVQEVLAPWPEIKVSRISSRILANLHGAPVADVLARLQRVFGISSVSPVAVAPLDIDAITRTAIKIVRQAQAGHRTFKVEVKRGNKRFVMDSLELASHVGGAILEAIPALVVDVHNPDIVVQIDVRDQGVYLYAEKLTGAGGLPLGMSGDVGGLLSGGIDSPVAVWQAMKRGLTVNLVHFHSFPFTSERAQRKVEDLVRTLAEWSHVNLNLHLASVTEIQSAIQQSSPEYLRTILLRRMMFRIATELGHQRGWLALVTGDSLGQVASQTLEGLYVVDEATDLSVIRPLVTEDKLDIIARARAIGTYETSIQPYDDCCSLFAPRRPKTRPTLGEVIEAERKMDIPELVSRAVDTAEQKSIGRTSEIALV